MATGSPERIGSILGMIPSSSIRSAPDPSQAQDDVKIVDIRISHAQSVELSPRPVRRTPSADAGVNGMLTAIWEYLACCARSSWWTCFRG